MLKELLPSMKTPAEINQENWIRTAVVYQIYPRSFKDTSKNGIGDLNGIIEKLDYLNNGTEKSLGVDAIWLSPVYKSPMVDFGYDVSDYYNIDPMFGTLETFDKLTAEVHKRSMKLIIDFIPNHTSSKHPWFLESCASRNNPKRDWYVWHDPKPDGSPPNNWLSNFGGSAWSYEERTKQYYLHSWAKEQPDLNWRNDEVRNEMNRILKFWLDRGVDGFRVDAVPSLIEDRYFRDDIPNPNYVPGKDNPLNKFHRVYSQGRPETIDIINSFCNILERYKNKFMVTESHIQLPEMIKMYQACDSKVHFPFNFNLMDLPWRAQAFKKFINTFDKSLGAEDWPNYVLGNHDLARLISRIGKSQARVAAMLLLTLRGTPFIYYGEEIGMKDVNTTSERIQDILEKQIPGKNLGRDPERSPMQWSKHPYGGFSKVEPWLPVAADYKTVNVESESAEPSSMLNLYRKLIHYRQKSSALIQGTYQSMDLENEDIFAFVRDSKKEKVVVLLNFSNKQQKASLAIKNAKVICNTLLDKGFGSGVNLENLTLGPNEGYLVDISKG